MSYAVIERIDTAPVGDKSCRIELHEKGGATPGTIPVFPVGGTRLSFQMTSTGLGWLNQSLTLRIFDTPDDKYYNLFNNIDSDKYAIRVSLTNSDVTDRLIFWGFPEYQLITSAFLDDGRKVVTARFYTPVQFKTRINYNDSDVQTELTKGQGSVVDSKIVRFGQFFSDLIFDSYPEQKYAYISKLRPNKFRGSSWPSTVEYAQLNEMYFQQDAVKDRDITLSEYFMLIVRTFFLRSGLSFTYGIPSFVACNAGRVDNEYNVATVDMANLINIQSGRLFVNATTKTDDVPLPTFSKDKIIKGAEKTDVPPLWSVTYQRVVSSVAGTTLTATEKNSANIASPLLYESYESPLIPFSPNPTPDVDTPESIWMAVFTGGSGTSNIVSVASGSPEVALFTDPEFDEALTLELVNLLAKMDLLVRNRVGRLIRFGYMGILDPMLNYNFSEDAKRLYVFTRGEYDLINQITYIDEGFTFRPVLEEDVVFDEFEARVLADSGTFETPVETRAEIERLADNELLDSLSLGYVAGGYKASKWYNIKGATGDLAVTRASTADRTARNGATETVGNNITAVDYSAGVLKGAQVFSADAPRDADLIEKTSIAASIPVERGAILIRGAWVGNGGEDTAVIVGLALRSGGAASTEGLIIGIRGNSDALGINSRNDSGTTTSAIFESYTKGDMVNILVEYDRQGGAANTTSVNGLKAWVNGTYAGAFDYRIPATDKNYNNIYFRGATSGTSRSRIADMKIKTYAIIDKAITNDVGIEMTKIV